MTPLTQSPLSVDADKGDFATHLNYSSIVCIEQIPDCTQADQTEPSDISPIRRLRVKSLASIKPEPVSWLWDDRIPQRKLTVIVGDPNVGKSFLWCDLASRVSTGDPMPDSPDKRSDAGRVLVLAAEDGLGDTIRPRIDAAGGNPSNIDFIEGVEDSDKAGLGMFKLDQHIALLEAQLDKAPAKMIVIDVTVYRLAMVRVDQSSSWRLVC